MPRFLHTADWQIGRQYPRFAPEDGAALVDARFSVIERIAALASVESVDAVLVAGDALDAQTVSECTIRCLFNAMAGYTGGRLISRLAYADLLQEADRPTFIILDDAQRH